MLGVLNKILSSPHKVPVCSATDCEMTNLAARLQIFFGYYLFTVATIG